MSLNEELRRTFEVAAMRREARHLETPRQWREANALLQRCAKARAHEKDLYLARYESRTEARHRRLIDEAGRQSGPGFRPFGVGADRFDPHALRMQAERDVRAAHAGRLIRIEEIERRGLAALLARSHQENGRRGQAREAFARASSPAGGMQPTRSRRQD